MVKKVLILIVLLGIVCPTACGEGKEGFRFWGLSEKRFDSESAVVGRVGYEFNDFLFADSNNTIEPFVGSYWIPKQDAETGNIDPPQMLTFGGIYHMWDLVDPNNPLPWISDILLEAIPEEMVAKPYIFWQGTWNIADDDVGLTGGGVGIRMKTKPEDRLEYIVEMQYTNFLDKISVLRDDDEWVLFVGVRFGF